MEPQQKLMIETVFKYFGPGTEFYDRVIGIGNNRYGLQGNSEDLFQNSALNAGIKVHQYKYDFSQDMAPEDIDKLGGWFFAIFINQCLDFKKKKTRQKQITNSISSYNKDEYTKFSFLMENRFLVDFDYQEPKDILVHEEDKARKLSIVSRGLEQIPEISRETFIRHHIQRQKQREIADALGIPIGTVKSRLFNSYQVFKQSFSKEDEKYLREVA